MEAHLMESCIPFLECIREDCQNAKILVEVWEATLKLAGARGGTKREDTKQDLN